MFQNLASYILGITTNTSNGSAGGINDDADVSSRVSLRTTDHDDGWTIVDRDSEGNSDEYSSEEEDNVSDSGLERVRLNRAGSNDSLTRAQVHDMEESWFVTPPPCFSSQTGPVQLRTSPLENLLIEHPSMSVYQRNGSRHPHFRTPTPSDTAEELETEEAIEDRQTESMVVVRQARPPAVAPHRCSRAEALQLSEMQLAKNRQAQKLQGKKLAQQAGRGYLNRANKAREVNGRNWNLRRKERCQGSVRSHANNNRKC